MLQGDHAIIKKSSSANNGDRFWESNYNVNGDSNWLISLRKGSRFLLPTNTQNGIWFSPGGNHLVYFDASQSRHYFSWDLRTGRKRDISPNVPALWLGNGYTYRFSLSDEKPVAPYGIAAWVGKKGLMVYDNNDIWQLDLEGKTSAVNFTNGLGRINSIRFSLINSEREYSQPLIIPIVKVKKSLLLRSFNIQNKCNGFYKKTPGQLGDPQLLSTMPYFLDLIQWCHDPNLSSKGMPAVKAIDTDFWIVQKQSEIDAPNYYSTKDFKSFNRLTNFQPQLNYHWLTEELYQFKHLDGRAGEGILYKPENFDSSKKYPVLVIFYGTYSSNHHQFPVPRYNSDAITPGVSPIWFLNNGYLIFTPDIKVNPLKYGPEAFNVIEGAATFLKQLPFVDSNGLGVCSHSWSAKLGAYIFTHSKSFSAMAISEGYLYANIINTALSLDDEGESKLESVETGFEFGNLWENKDSWLDQTTVLNVDKSQSPLLLFCNKGSSDDYRNQTLQLFTALRRLEKKVWWLKYDQGGHNVNDIEDQKDYTIRSTQYFDHYLKGAPAPRWMTAGIPAKVKGFESRYELNPAGSCDLEGKFKCRICKKWNERYQENLHILNEPISKW